MALEEGVLDLGRRLEKLVSEGHADSEDALSLLQELQSTPVTLDVLQKTRIGMSVNVVRKASNKDDIQSLAKSLIKTWKKLLDSQDKTKTKPPLTTATTTAVTTSQNDASGNGESIPSQTIVHSNGGTKQAYPTYKGDLGVRDKCREMIANSLKCDDHTENEIEQVAGDLEEAIYKEFKDTGTKYKNRIKSRVMNLRDKNNPNLKLLVLCGTISAERFAVMRPEELASEDLKKLRKEMTEQAIKDHQLSVTGGTGTDQFKCGRCGKRNCTYNQVQTRSADEPMTTFVLCNECGKRWKFC